MEFFKVVIVSLATGIIFVLLAAAVMKAVWG